MEDLICDSLPSIMASTMLPNCLHPSSMGNSDIYLMPASDIFFCLALWSRILIIAVARASGVDSAREIPFSGIS